MPVPAQNSCLREYVARNNGRYVLPHLESNFNNCFHQLFGLVNEMEINSALVMYSVLMLPQEIAKRKSVFANLKEKNIKICTVLENISTNEYDDCEIELTNYLLQRLACKRSFLQDKLKGMNS